MMLPPDVGMVSVQRRLSAHGHAPFQMNVEIPREHASFNFSAVDFQHVCKNAVEKEIFIVSKNMVPHVSGKPVGNVSNIKVPIHLWGKIWAFLYFDSRPKSI
eukprot:10764840-Ditylum_brightwellii.AAC.1